MYYVQHLDVIRFRQAGGARPDDQHRRAECVLWPWSTNREDACQRWPELRASVAVPIRLQLPIHAMFPLTEAHLAHREVQTGHVRGKVVLTVP
ncbi:zinc-binding dehydrogenase [Dactylosporangium roseum]|uniref:Zinc-binding dehydrogenase n=1 Tax=Dactylosporangium roseum TaxID=47989 RepID=A0ABY5Z3N3_9ACTN|nr:zinc-binding dehydrogenase [Dactylosporangium roseum]